VGNIIAFLLNLVRIKCYIVDVEVGWIAWWTRDVIEFVQIGPKGLEFGRYSLDYHTIRNYLYVKRAWGSTR
jgi:hypothetical protein